MACQLYSQKQQIMTSLWGVCKCWSAGRGQKRKGGWDSPPSMKQGEGGGDFGKGKWILEGRGEVAKGRLKAGETSGELETRREFACCRESRQKRDRAMKDWVACFDGTRNREKTGTNVYRLYQFLCKDEPVVESAASGMPKTWHLCKKVMAVTSCRGNEKCVKAGEEGLDRGGRGGV